MQYPNSIVRQRQGAVYSVTIKEIKVIHKSITSRKKWFFGSNVLDTS